MIRTAVVSLTTIPAVAYRQKLAKGGSGIVIVRDKVSQPGIASISKTSGEAIPAPNTPVKSYPAEAFKEAQELTKDLPYKKLGAVKYVQAKVVEEKPVAEEGLEEETVVVDSKDYKAVVKKYSDKSGKLSYELLNRDLIKFAHTSSKVRAMVAEKESEKKIRLYVIGAKFRSISGNNGLTDGQVQKIADLLDEVSPKGVFKEFNSDIRAALKNAKKA
ncbi:MAG: hypothetical protein J6Z46_10990 [Lachnospiraceae bacterium]|nr:hypothetical protein [Lachnospiraceae bacterium]